MAIVNKKTAGIAAQDLAKDSRATNGMPLLCVTGVAEVATSDDDTSTYRILRLPSNAVLVNLEIASDALGTLAAYDIGVYETEANGGAAVDDDEFGSSISLASMIDWTNVLNEASAAFKERIGQPLWQRIGLTSDPGKSYDIVATGDTAGDAAGSICLRAYYYIK